MTLRHPISEVQSRRCTMTANRGSTAAAAPPPLAAPPSPAERRARFARSAFIEITRIFRVICFVLYEYLEL